MTAKQQYPRDPRLCCWLTVHPAWGSRWIAGGLLQAGLFRIQSHRPLRGLPLICTYCSCVGMLVCCISWTKTQRCMPCRGCTLLFRHERMRSTALMMLVSSRPLPQPTAAALPEAHVHRWGGLGARAHQHLVRRFPKAAAGGRPSPGLHAWGVESISCTLYVVTRDFVVLRMCPWARLALTQAC